MRFSYSTYSTGSAKDIPRTSRSLDLGSVPLDANAKKSRFIVSVESKLRMAFGRDIKVDTMTMKIGSEEPEEFHENLSAKPGAWCLKRHVAMSEPVALEKEYRQKWQEVTQSLHNSYRSSAQGSTNE
jgi:hypothetical protein